MIDNVEELLAQAEKIEEIEARIKFIMKFFLENVKYNYACLFAKGYVQGTISAVSNNFTIATNKTRTEGDEEFSLTQSIAQGESQTFNDILRIRDENSENYNEFINRLRSYITSELKNHLANDELVDENVSDIIKKIENGLRKKTKINNNGNAYEVNHDISMVLIEFLLQPKTYFPPEFKNGLITNGVCADYTDYLMPLLQKLGIEAHRATGTSELGHAWIIIKNGEKYKSIDLTRAVVIRDGSLGIPPGQTSEDWLYCDLEDIFKMQNTRSIKKIDNKQLAQVINGQNYDEESFIKIMEEQIVDSTFKNLIKSGLKKGITETETSNAEQFEIHIEKEEEFDE